MLKYWDTLNAHLLQNSSPTYVVCHLNSLWQARTSRFHSWASLPLTGHLPWGLPPLGGLGSILGRPLHHCCNTWVRPCSQYHSVSCKGCHSPPDSPWSSCFLSERDHLPLDLLFKPLKGFPDQSSFYEIDVAFPVLPAWPFAFVGKAVHLAPLNPLSRHLLWQFPGLRGVYWLGLWHKWRYQRRHPPTSWINLWLERLAEDLYVSLNKNCRGPE